MTFELTNIYQWSKNWAEENKLHLWHQKECSSTNDTAKEEEGFDLYLTEHQTRGRGRGQNNWQDLGRGGEFLSTWSFLLSSSPQHITGPLLGLAIYKSASAIWPDGAWSLKAPNDLYLGDKKIAGLLTEIVSNGKEYRLLIGFGFNVFSAPTDIENSSCLIHHLEGELTSSRWNSFLNQLLEEFKVVANSCQEKILSTEHQQELLIALNKNPNLPQPYTKIDEQSNLYTGEKKTPWQNL